MIHLFKSALSSSEDTTSPLVSPAAILFWGSCFLIALWLSQNIAAALFLTLCLAALLAQLWAAFAIRRVSLCIQCSRNRLFPGQNTTLSYHITNAKLLPLPWMELLQNGPEKDCLLPMQEMERIHEPGTPEDDPLSIRTRFSMVEGYREITLSVTYEAHHRGLYHIHHLRALTGDGLGLVQRSAILPAGQIPSIAIYPAIVDVDLSPFLRTQWDTTASQVGWMEDQTILRGNREYQPGDSWRAINWRMAAREQGLPINLYQTISPFRIHFILDGESFARHEEDLEEMLSILASLLLSLSLRSIELSASISQSEHFPAITLSPEASGDVSEILYYLAGFQPLAKPDDSREYVNGTPVLLPSLFPERVIPDHGSCWLITRTGSRLPEALISRMNPAGSHILCMEQEEIPAAIGWRAINLRQLRT